MQTQFSFMTPGFAVEMRTPAGRLAAVVFDTFFDPSDLSEMAQNPNLLTVVEV
jgi:hypothetical protein